VLHRVGEDRVSVAQAREYRDHVATTGLVLVALVASWVEAPIDRAAAVVIAGVVVKTRWDLLSDAMRVLLDASLDRHTLADIERTIAGDVAVSEVTWVTGRNAGRFRFVEAGVALRVRGLEVAEAAVRPIEASVRAAVPNVDRIVLQVEPPATPYVRYAVPLTDPLGTVSEHFGQAPCFALVLVERADAAVLDQEIVDNPHRGVVRGKGLPVAEWLVSLNTDVVVTREPLAEVLGTPGQCGVAGEPNGW
jgi:hypothetical protein